MIYRYQGTITAQNTQKIQVSGVILKDNQKFATETSIDTNGKCFSQHTVSQFGEYAIEVPAPMYNIPYFLQINYSSGLLKATRTLQVGGIPSNLANIGPTSLVSQLSLYTIVFAAEFLHGSAVEFSVLIRDGYNNFTGNAVNVTNSVQVLNGVYSFTAVANGYKSDVIEMMINSNKTLYFIMISEKFDENEARIVLSWNGQVSLMMRSSFVLNSDIDCEVSFTNKVCGGVKITNTQGFSDHGVEEMSVKPIGAYQYLFYAIQENPGNYSGQMKVYIKGETLPVARFGLGSEYMWNTPSNDFKVWAGFCMDGVEGVSSVIGIQSYLSILDQNNLRNICAQFFGETQVFEPNDDYSLNVKKRFNIPKNIIRY